ncbi:MAG: hypothetical protein EOP05_14370 [Proteobacteria bacterium]|nr:MAG: hypothetical protein EOP05_14370 [Pseudomonadota bacterium]
MDAQKLKIATDRQDCARKLQFQDQDFIQAQQQWIAILEGTSIHLGFESIRGINPGNATEAKLQSFRESIDISKFSNHLSRFQDKDFESRGLRLKCHPAQWFSSEDVPLSKPVDVHALKERLYALDSFVQEKNAEFILRESSGGFFMMALQLSPKFFIGVGATNSLFNLSTLAHEIGHTTASVERNVEKEFLTYPASAVEGFIFSNEVDSYKYELLFMRKISHFSAIISSQQSVAEIQDRLLKRKAIQNNIHLLKHKLNAAFFGGEPLKEIAKSFRSQIESIYPSFPSVSQFDWIEYATLDQPLSRIPYIEAYERTFGMPSVTYPWSFSN